MTQPETELRQAIQRTDPAQRKNLGHVALFFAVLLVLTLLARGMSAAALPTVAVQAPTSGRVTKSISATGTVACAGGTPFTVPAGLLVTGVAVQVGDTVAPGQPLATLEGAEVARAVAAKQAELTKAQTQAAQQKAGESADPYTVELTQDQLLRAYEDTHRTYAQAQEQVARAREDLQQVKDKAEAARNAPYETEEEEKAALEAAQAQVEAAEDALFDAELAADNANHAALAAAQSIEDSRNTAIHDYYEQQQELAKANALNRAEAAVTQAQCAALQAELDALLAVQAAGYAVTAPMGGTVTQLDLTPGKATAAVGGLLADADTPYTLAMPLTEEQAKLVTVGQTLKVTQGKTSGECAVTALSAPDADGTVTAAATLPQGSWNAGAAQVDAAIEGAQQPLVLPATAVNRDNTGPYVLAVEQQQTVLGLQNVLVRLTVSVLETGDTTTAVTGAVDRTTQVVVNSDKPVTAGARVRVDE